MPWTLSEPVRSSNCSKFPLRLYRPNRPFQRTGAIKPRRALNAVVLPDASRSAPGSDDAA